MPAFSRLLVLVCCAVLATGGPARAAAAEPGPQPPNVVWLTVEDMSPWIRPYGDRTGTMHMRNSSTSDAAIARRPDAYRDIPRYEGVPPPFVRCFPEHLRAAGYEIGRAHV